MKFRKYTKEQLIEAVANSTSIRQTLFKLDVIPAGGNYQVIKNYIKNLSLDTSHFKGMGWCKGMIFGEKRPVEDYLSNNFQINSHRLRKRLIKEEIFQPICSSCNLSEWLSKPIPLELDHIDGNHQNNNLVNLRLLCPNCHAQTPTYRGKNIPFLS
ncbi:MAG: hypothetical protein AABY07_00785 [Nanoarchaeota archaeon]